ncbi:Aste57867_11824 [Aphanomyces stellatus]|uniref:Aste57867_11824 protein n=1 Tax=Aphanomyces stellatus TaxID=120398 RepID=A0A485KUH8_9STRA|nr:hypothetical protein As57867_011779 [Aphanomyces stellatus]VFT88679.1 Aste57867_11824 [Aphanomyces stellatus]
MQSIKWLGLVAAQRYALMLPHGRCRTREDAHSKNGFYLPSEVRNAEGELLSPWSRIVECCRENETISIVLQHEVPVDDIGVPQLSSWALSAFSNDNQQHFEDDANAEADEKDDDGPRSRLRNPNVYGDLRGYSSSFHANHVKSGQFISQEELESAFYHDVSYLKLDEFLKDSKDKEEVEDVLLKYYDCLVAIYKHYSIGYGEDLYSMSALEFYHFVHETMLLHYVKDATVLDKILAQVLADATTSMTLPRVLFLQATVRVIVTHNKMYGDDVPFIAALEAALKDYVQPTGARLTSGPFRDKTHTDGMLAMFQEAKPKLVKVYDKYASGKHAKVDGPVLSVSDFRSLIQDSGIFCTGDSDRHEQLFDAAIQQCFNGMKEIKDGEKQFLVFVEFVEVICRLSLGIWEDKDVSPKETIRIGLEAVRALAKAK